MRSGISKKVIILGAGKPFSGRMHSGLLHIDKHGAVLEWLLSAFKKTLQVADSDIQFVGGYKLETVAHQYPNLTYILNPNWEKTGALHSLFCAGIEVGQDLIVSYSDIVYWPKAVEDLCTAGDDAIIVAIDDTFPKRHLDSGAVPLSSTETVHLSGGVAVLDNKISDRTVEFPGLIRVPGQFIPYLLELQSKQDVNQPSTLHLSALIDEFIKIGVPVKCVNIAGYWSDLNSPAALTRFVMGTKAQTLSRLEECLKTGSVCPQICFRRSDFLKNTEQIIENINARFNQNLLAIRSSALSEDSFLSANAGVFHSELNVSTQKVELDAAIRAVIKSFPDDGMDHQVFVQPMVKNVIASGVAMTRLIQTGAPYYSINYTVSDRTDLVTGGRSEDDRVMIIARNCEAMPLNAPEWAAQLMVVIEELEFLLGHDALDIEFAVNRDREIYVLQVRPIILSDIPSDQADGAISDIQEQAISLFRDLQIPRPGCVGKRAAFGVMPDWNPAEIIGTRPSNLSAGLYAYLIMDGAWAKQRAEYGYRDVQPQPLMRQFAGQPYVDIRASLNSFIPFSIDDGLASRLVDFYMQWLENNPSLHDKIEFDVVPTCYAFDFKKWEGRLFKDGAFTNDEISKLKMALLNITNKGIERIDADWEKISDIEVIYTNIVKSMPASTIQRAMTLLDSCAINATLVFAHLARAGFVAMTLLRSAVSTNVLSADRVQDFLLSINTVSSQFSADAAAVRNENMTFDAFVEKYGHLRPGTYDVTSPRYSDNPEFYLRSAVKRAEDSNHNKFVWTQSEKDSLQKSFLKHGISCDVGAFDNFCRKATEGRELAKFVFTRFLSDAIEDICSVAKDAGLSRADAAMIPWSVWKSLSVGMIFTSDIPAYLKGMVEQNRVNHEYMGKLELPPLIFSERDFQSFLLPVSHPNFITDSRVVSDLVVLQGNDFDPKNLVGSIVQIDAADPGYDWLFGQGIVGLITKYGGANSHMAIRAAEYGLPAAIGVGSVRYAELAPAKKIDLNCKNRQIVVIE